MGECPVCHKTGLINKRGYCDTCQTDIEWFFMKKEETSFFWQILVYFIFFLTIVTLIGIGTVSIWMIVSIIQYLF